MTTKKKINFTFKTHRPTGNYAWLYKPYHDVLLNKNKVGSIEPVKPFSIRLMVMKADIMEDGNSNCPWKWITLKHESESLDDAKTFLNESIDIILRKYKIREYKIKNNEK
jgi:hypothetical protein